MLPDPTALFPPEEKEGRRGSLRGNLRTLVPPQAEAKTVPCSNTPIGSLGVKRFTRCHYSIREATDSKWGVIAVTFFAYDSHVAGRIDKLRCTVRRLLRIPIALRGLVERDVPYGFPAG